MDHIKHVDYTMFLICPHGHVHELTIRVTDVSKVVQNFALFYEEMKEAGWAIPTAEQVAEHRAKVSAAEAQQDQSPRSKMEIN